MKMRAAGNSVRFMRVAAALACLIGAALAQAQAQAWPTKPIRIINGNAPGGSADVSARVVSEMVARALGQPFVIESRPGASGGIAMDAVARAAPDGYTLLIGSDSSLYQPILKPALPHTIEKNFSPIVILTSQPLVLAVHASLKVKTAAELVALAKSSAAPLPYATPSAGGTQTVAGAAFARVAGITLTNIPYKGGGQAVGDLASGQVPVGVLGSAPLIPFARGVAARVAPGRRQRHGFTHNRRRMCSGRWRVARFLGSRHCNALAIAPLLLARHSVLVAVHLHAGTVPEKAGRLCAGRHLRAVGSAVAFVLACGFRVAPGCGRRV